MKIISLVSQKGGSGKTTLAIHLAVEAATRGERALLVDCDPQASASRWADRRQGQAVDIDVSSEQAARLDAVLAQARGQGYTVAVLDTAPNADQAALRAARAADAVLTPCRPSILDLDAITATLEICALARIAASVVLNAAPVRSRVTDEARRAVQGNGGVVCPVVVHERVALRHSLVDGRGAREYEPDGAAAAEISALYDAIMSSCNHAITKGAA